MVQLNITISECVCGGGGGGYANNRKSKIEKFKYPIASQLQVDYSQSVVRALHIYSVLDKDGC